MPTKAEEAALLLDALGGMVQTLVDRAEELGVEVTAQQLATNVLPQLGRLAGDMLAHHREHGSLDGVQLTFVSAETSDQQDLTNESDDDDSDGM